MRRIESARLLNSIKEFYPNLPVVIVDDSSEEMDYDFTDNMRYYHLPYDSGISKGRNVGLDQVNTEYFVLLDDDTYFKETTDLNIFLDFLESTPQAALIAGVMDNSNSIQGTFEYIAGGLIINGLNENEENITQVDIAQNFFMAKTKDVKEVRWDERLKINEHFDFFIRFKNEGYICYHTDLVNIGHGSQNVLKYNQMRERKNFKGKALEYHDLDFINFPYGRTIKRKK